MVGKRAPTKDRFISKFTKLEVDVCWPWNANTNGAGYGMIWSPEDGRKVLAHRYSYALHVGPIPSGGLILHSCDNPRCVNPSHLRAGNFKDNVSDMDERNRRVSPHLRGEDNPSSLLTAEQVSEIRRLYIDGVHCEVIASQFGISPLSMPDFISGKSWKHTLDDETRLELKAERKKRSKPGALITQEIADEIRRRLAAGAMGKDLAVEFGIHKATVSDIKLRKIWADA